MVDKRVGILFKTICIGCIVVSIGHSHAFYVVFVPLEYIPIKASVYVFPGAHLRNGISAVDHNLSE